MDDAALRQEVLSRFPDDALLDVRITHYDPSKQPSALEPGEVSIFLVPRGPEEYNAAPEQAPAAIGQQVVREFQHRYLAIVQQLRQELPGMLSERLRFTGAQFGPVGESTGISGPPTESAAGLVPVMTRLAPTDVETLDLLIAAGMASSRAEAVRWCLGRIRERPAFQELQASVRRIEQLKAAF